MPFSLLRPFLSIHFSLFPGVALWRVLFYFSARLVAAASPPLFSVLLPAQQVQLFSFLVEKNRKKIRKFSEVNFYQNWKLGFEFCLENQPRYRNFQVSQVIMDLWRHQFENFPTFLHEKFLKISIQKPFFNILFSSRDKIRKVAVSYDPKRDPKN